MRKTCVVAYYLNGKLYRIFPSAKEAAILMNHHPRTIDKCIRGERLTVNGFMWKRFNVDEIPQKIAPLKRKTYSHKNKPIALLDEAGNIKKIYPSIRRASLDLNINPHSIRDNLNHIINYAGKCQFRYLSKDVIKDMGIIINHSKDKKKKSRK